MSKTPKKEEKKTGTAPAKSGSPKNDLKESLKRACAGLVYISETDAEFEPFLDGPATSVDAKTIRKAAGLSSSGAVEERSVADFFSRLTTEKEWHGPREKKIAERFSRLEKFLLKHLSDPRVFRFGSVRIEIFIVGLTAAGELAGVRTSAVET